MLAAVLGAMLACLASAQLWVGQVWGDRTERGWFGLDHGFAAVEPYGSGWRGVFRCDSPAYPFDYIDVWAENGAYRFAWWNFWYGRFGSGTGTMEIEAQRLDGSMRWRLSVASRYWQGVDRIYADLRPR